MGGCLGLLGFESAKECWEHHPLYHAWKFKGWADVGHARAVRSTRWSTFGGWPRQRLSLASDRRSAVADLARVLAYGHIWQDDDLIDEATGEFTRAAKDCNTL
jgi:hypothetical protein